jgi:Cu/Ag efflux protein CusF
MAMYNQLKLSTPLLATLLALAGCGDTQTEPDASATPTANATAAMGEMAGMQAATDTIKAKSTGTITALDKRAGKVTLDHEAIPEAKWPAMTMGFDADPALLGELSVGDRVAFDVEIAGSSGKVTAITKQQ